MKLLYQVCGLLLVGFCYCGEISNHYNSKIKRDLNLQYGHQSAAITTGFINEQGRSVDSGINQNGGNGFVNGNNHFNKQMPVSYPQLVQVAVKNIPYQVNVPVPVKIDRPYPVHVPRPYPVAVDQPVPYPVDRPYPIKFNVPYGVPVPVQYPVSVPQPYPVPIIKSIPIHIPQYNVVKQPYPVYIPNNAITNYGFTNGFGGGYGTSFKVQDNPKVSV